jgi:hypothetical protein
MMRRNTKYIFKVMCKAALINFGDVRLAEGVCTASSLDSSVYRNILIPVGHLFTNNTNEESPFLLEECLSVNGRITLLK